MMTLLNSKGKKVGSFNNDDDLFRYITHIESLKMLEGHKYFAQTAWSFGIYSARDVYELYHQMDKNSITPTLKYAYEHQLGILDICVGDYKNPTEIAITSDLDIESHQSKWCRAYCKAHGYQIIKNEREGLVSPTNANKENEQ